MLTPPPRSLLALNALLKELASEGEKPAEVE